MQLWASSQRQRLCAIFNVSLVVILTNVFLFLYSTFVGRRNVVEPFSNLMADGMLRDNSRVSTALCRNGEVPFVVSWVARLAESIAFYVYISLLKLNASLMKMCICAQVCSTWRNVSRGNIAIFYMCLKILTASFFELIWISLLFPLHPLTGDNLRHTVTRGTRTHPHITGGTLPMFDGNYNYNNHYYLFIGGSLRELHSSVSEVRQLSTWAACYELIIWQVMYKCSFHKCTVV